ncbi:hypothetical protein KY290_031153 [Solanum tuberosum]|uniref:Uncharacterized protein n=1 Tax=Solanum tuberosum TaxID=4113 RepID=A0ABQ7U8H7_SOLTU|nr:hypothetical protein KY290_031153 [Solanum tuberosum]
MKGYLTYRTLKKGYHLFGNSKLAGFQAKLDATLTQGPVSIIESGISVCAPAVVQLRTPRRLRADRSLPGEIGVRGMNLYLCTEGDRESHRMGQSFSSPRLEYQRRTLQMPGADTTSSKAV